MVKNSWHSVVWFFKLKSIRSCVCTLYMPCFVRCTITLCSGIHLIFTLALVYLRLVVCLPFTRRHLFCQIESKQTHICRLKLSTIVQIVQVKEKKRISHWNLNKYQTAFNSSSHMRKVQWQMMQRMAMREKYEAKTRKFMGFNFLQH